MAYHCDVQEEPDVDDELAVARLKKGGMTAQRIAFGVAKQHLERRERDLAIEWLDKAFYLLPKKDQIELLIGAISLYPGSHLRGD